MSPEETRELDRRVAEARGYPTLINVDDDGKWYEYCAMKWSTDPAASRVLLDEMAAEFVMAVEYSGLGGANVEGWRPSASIPSTHGPTLDIAIVLAWLSWREGAKS